MLHGNHLMMAPYVMDPLQLIVSLFLIFYVTWYSPNDGPLRNGSVTTNSISLLDILLHGNHLMMAPYVMDPLQLTVSLFLIFYVTW
jgi:hypothetical protein